MTFSTFIKGNNFFIIPVLIFIGTGIFFIALFTKSSIHLVINSNYSALADGFFKYITYLGEGIVFVAGGILLLLSKRKHILGLIFTSILAVFITGILKYLIFAGEPRPFEFFKTLNISIRFVDGVEVNHWNSFPSGHTTAAFAFWGFMAFLAEDKRLKFGFFVLAALTAYSRMYLSQHFLEDVIAGSALGVSIALLSYLLMENLNSTWWQKKWRQNKV